MSRFLHLYQYLAPLLLGPLSLWLWWRFYQGQWGPVALAWGLPCCWAYLVPAVGTNFLGMWEFDVRFRLGRFRPHHGFVFGSATATLAWLVHPIGPAGPAYALVLAGVLGWINLLYDVEALKSGLLKVYNQPWSEGRGPEAVAMDYAPWFFGGFGAVYGLILSWLEWQRPEVDIKGFLGALALTILVPCGGYMLQSRRRHGHWGVHPCR